MVIQVLAAGSEGAGPAAGGGGGGAFVSVVTLAAEGGRGQSHGGVGLSAASVSGETREEAKPSRCDPGSADWSKIISLIIGPYY